MKKLVVLLMTVASVIVATGFSKSEPYGTSQAVCESRLPLGSHGPVGWCGPKRSAYNQAKIDAETHNKTYEGHSASVCSGSCPTCD